MKYWHPEVKREIFETLEELNNFIKENNLKYRKASETHPIFKNFYFQEDIISISGTDSITLYYWDKIE